MENKRSKFTALIALAIIVSAFIVFPLLAASLSYRRVLTHQTWFTQIPGVLFSDTNYFTAWTPATDGGPHNGGYVLGWVGDAHWDGVHGAHMIPVVVNSYDPANISGTDIKSANGTGNNSLSAWLNAGQTWPGAAEQQTASASFSMFSLRGDIYLPIGMQGQNYSSARLAMLISPREEGTTPTPYLHHICNWATYQAYGGCTSAHWSATGDAPAADTVNIGGTNYAAFQWTNGDWATVKMGRLSCMMWGQDTATGPVVPAGVDPAIDTNYTYCVSMVRQRQENPQLPSLMYSSRFLTSGNPMDPANWQYRVNGTYVANNWNGMTAMTIDPSVDMTAMWGQSVIYSPDAKKFFMHLASPPGGRILSADYPWGPTWTVVPTTSTLSPAAGGFTGWMPHTYKSLGDGAFSISNTNEDFVCGCALGFEEWSFFPLSGTQIKGGTTVRGGRIY